MGQTLTRIRGISNLLILITSREGQPIVGEIAWWKRIITKNDILKINLSGIKYIFGQEALSEYILKSKHSERDGASMSPKKSCFETIGSCN